MQKIGPSCYCDIETIDGPAKVDVFSVIAVVPCPPPVKDSPPKTVRKVVKGEDEPESPPASPPASDGRPHCRVVLACAHSLECPGSVEEVSNLIFGVAAAALKIA